MADNVAITAGSGTTIATDDVAGVHFQKAKLDVGGDGASVAARGTADGALATFSYPRVAAYRNSATAAAPAASAVIADSGQVAAGDYRVEWSCMAADTLAVGKGCVVELRNAANGATLHRLGGCVAGESQTGVVERITLALNERVRIIAGTAAGAASSLYVGHVALYPLP